MLRPAPLSRSPFASALAASSLALLAACSGGGSPTDTTTTTTALVDTGATVALGDVGFGDLSEFHVTFHELGLAGSGVTSYLVQEGVHDPVTIDALGYQGTAAPIASRQIAAGTYDTLFFKITVTAKDLDGDDVPTYTPFAPETDLYQEIETVFPLGALNGFTVAEPAADNQPLLFLHVDVANSVREGNVASSIVATPRIFLSTSLAEYFTGTVTRLDAENGLFEVEDTNGKLHAVQPTQCTLFNGGFGAGQSGLGVEATFADLAVGDELQLQGTLGVDPGCQDTTQKAVFFHPHTLTRAAADVGITVVHGLIEEVVDQAGVPIVRVLAAESTNAAGTAPGAVDRGDFVDFDMTSTSILTSRGEVQDLTGSALSLQIGERVRVATSDLTETTPGNFDGTGLVAFVSPSNLTGMLEGVVATSMTIADLGTKKGSGNGHPARSYWPDDVPSGPPLGGPQPLQVAFGTAVDVFVGVDSEVRVGPLGGWRLTQVLDPDYDNQLAGPGGEDGLNLGGAQCVDPVAADVDIDSASLVAYFDHDDEGGGQWTISRLEVTVAADAMQKYVAWFQGLQACNQPANGSWANQPCIAVESLHRERINLGDTFAPNWRNLGQTGAGVFGTSILNSGSRVPGATTPQGSDTAGWDDVAERVLLGLDFDGDMYPFDNTAESCSEIAERAWVDLSAAQFFYFNVDPGTGAIDVQYLNTYADFKAKVIELQDDQDSVTCGPGFNLNAGFGFTGLIDKESLAVPSLGSIEVVPVIHAISGTVFQGGCVPQAL